MTKSIISSAEVLATAFADGGYLPAETISEADIISATDRWVRPVVGQALLDAVAEGKYGELKSNYLLPAVAYYTRFLVQPRLNSATSGLGLTVANGSAHKAADRSAREELQRALKVSARTALRRLSDYLDEQKEQFAEYDAKKNILHHCCLEGGFVNVW